MPEEVQVEKSNVGAYRINSSNPRDISRDRSLSEFSAENYIKEDKKIFEMYYANEPDRVSEENIEMILTQLAERYSPGAKISGQPKGFKLCYIEPLNGKCVKLAGDKDKSLKDIEKNIDFSKFLYSKSKQLCGSAVDWARTDNPFYIVMVNLKGGDILSALDNMNTEQKAREALISFIGEYMAKESYHIEGQAKLSTKMTLDSLLEYTQKVNIPPEVRQMRVDNIEKIRQYFSQKIPSFFPTHNSIPDPHPSNILLADHVDISGSKPTIIVLSDQGLKKSVREAYEWSNEGGPYYTPMATILGQLFYDLKFEGRHKIPGTLDKLKCTFSKYTTSGKFNSSQLDADGGEEDALLRERLFALGGILAGTLFEYGHSGDLLAAETIKSLMQSFQ